MKTRPKTVANRKDRLLPFGQRSAFQTNWEPLQ